VELKIIHDLSEGMVELVEIPRTLETLEKGDKFVLENILFVGGRDELLPESEKSLRTLKNFLENNTAVEIRIEGHICCRYNGEDGLNTRTGEENLSIDRAKAIYNYLVSQNINAERLSYKGMKSKFPTGKGPVQDRRVEIVIVEK
jgi:outer membrane protein OmpA-like peptidoglycan-associated protein